MDLLAVHDLGCTTEDGSQIFSGVELTLHEGDVVVVQGKSGCGKTTFLKCLAHLNLYSGHILFCGKTPKSYGTFLRLLLNLNRGIESVTIGAPIYRTKVAYVPQRPPLLPGSPRDFLATASSFKARRKGKGRKDARSSEDFEHPLKIASSWGIDSQLWDREWTNLSGGETQRIALAIGLGLDTAEVLLLDEPTSALDQDSCLIVERHILDALNSSENPLKAIVWITHSPEQASRVGTRFLQFTGGSSYEEPSPPV
ncbi:P-loop containing nucleoside triphosphate hydrolase protein [Lentinula guzmanii]|uniref:P-loop containing nucleoside triphosphate hydrolase protein n=1 Tax=Lentinula guzmanii TaxID=2804957 RepID=A0AA38JAK5_9AGAR|nr:P-loop containing nucleoside triphosphate hydrolase protein [Lentinula guzmanii]